MASLAQLTTDVCGWLNRRDCLPVLPGWVLMLETELAETLRARCQVTSGFQAVDAPYIALPADFATMASIRDATTGELLELKDEWSGHWQSPDTIWSAACSTQYRLVGNCIEFLPHPVIPDPPDPAWVPQNVMMSYYARPRPLLLPTDTNPILEELYAVYLFGLLKYGAVWALDDDRAAQADAQWQQAVTRANLWKQQADMSGALLRSELVSF